jgi:hypothetical protein
MGANLDGILGYNRTKETKDATLVAFASVPLVTRVSSPDLKSDFIKHIQWRLIPEGFQAPDAQESDLPPGLMLSARTYAPDEPIPYSVDGKDYLITFGKQTRELRKRSKWWRWPISPVYWGVRGIATPIFFALGMASLRS